MKTISDMKIGTEMLVHYKDKREPEWFKFWGLKNTSQDKTIINKKYQTTGFIILGQPCRGTEGMISQEGFVIPVALFPETIEKITTEEE